MERIERIQKIKKRIEENRAEFENHLNAALDCIKRLKELDDEIIQTLYDGAPPPPPKPPGNEDD